MKAASQARPTWRSGSYHRTHNQRKSCTGFCRSCARGVFSQWVPWRAFQLHRETRPKSTKTHELSLTAYQGKTTASSSQFAAPAEGRHQWGKSTPCQQSTTEGHDEDGHTMSSKRMHTAQLIVTPPGHRLQRRLGQPSVDTLPSKLKDSFQVLLSDQQARQRTACSGRYVCCK